MKTKYLYFLILFLFVVSSSVFARARDCEIDGDCPEDYPYQYQYQTPEYAYPTPAYETPSYGYPTPPPSCGDKEHLQGNTCVPDGIQYAYPTPQEYVTPYSYQTPTYQTPGGTGQGGTWLNMNFVVTDQNGNGVSGALVTMNAAAGNGNTRITDGNGFANFGVYEKQVISFTVESNSCGGASGTLYFDNFENWAYPKLNCGGGYPTPYTYPTPPVYDYQTPGVYSYQTPPPNYSYQTPGAYFYQTPGQGYSYQTPGYQTPGVYSYQTPATTYTLNVSSSGGGTITSVDSFINCGTTCYKVYEKDVSVTLKATPKSSYWKFTGWSGDCSGTGDCVLNINSAKTVSGRFVPRLFIYKEF